MHMGAGCILGAAKLGTKKTVHGIAGSAKSATTGGSGIVASVAHVNMVWVPCVMGAVAFSSTYHDIGGAFRFSDEESDEY